MKVIAEELGVEFGEKFRLNVGAEGIVYVIEEDGLYRYMKDSCCIKLKCNERLHSIIVNYQHLEKLPWRPGLRDYYYYPHFEISCGFSSRFWEDSGLDKRIAATVGVYRTPEEAIEEAKKKGWV
jgi:hypothetical protein